MHPLNKVDDAAWPSLLTVGCANFLSVQRDKRATLEKLLTVVRDAARQGCDLVVFPELALNSWGECADCAARSRPCDWHLADAELAHGPTSDAVARVARELDIHVIYGFEEPDEDEAFENFDDVVAEATAEAAVVAMNSESVEDQAAAAQKPQAQAPKRKKKKISFV